MWGITIEQMRNLRRQPNFEQNMTMYDVVNKIVKPMTSGKGTGYALYCNKEAPLRAKVMVSHAWQENFVQFLETVEQSGLKGPFWVCAFSIYQNEDIENVTIQKQLGPSPSTGPFSTVLKQSDRMLAVMTNSCDIYTRLWCVYEIFIAITLNVPVSLAAFNEITTSFGGSDAMYSNAVLDSSGKPILTKCSGCGNKSDQKMIQNEIKKQPGGFDLIDDTVFWVRIKALIDDMPNARRKMWGETMSMRPIGTCSASNIVTRQNAAIANAIAIWKEIQGGRKKKSRNSRDDASVISTGTRTISNTDTAAAQSTDDAASVDASTAASSFALGRNHVAKSESIDNPGIMELVQERIFKNCASLVCN